MSQSGSVKWYGTAAKAKTKTAAARGLGLWAEHVLEGANRVVPVQEGTLRASGTTSVDVGGLRAAVSFDTPYAAKQHEDLTAYHSAGKTAKYLENPLNASKTTGPAIVAREIKKAL